MFSRDLLPGGREILVITMMMMMMINLLPIMIIFVLEHMRVLTDLDKAQRSETGEGAAWRDRERLF